MKMGLLLIDIQNDYFKGGKFELFGPEEAAIQTEQIISFFRKNDMPIFHVQHISIQDDAGFFLPNTTGAEIYKGVYPKDNETVIIKHTPDSFLNTDLKKALNNAGITDLIVCGMMTHMCVDTTVRAAKKLGYNITLIDDACATRDLIYDGEVIQAATVHKSFMASLNGTFADVVKAQQWLKNQA